MQPESNVVTHAVGVAKQLTPHVSKFHTDLAILHMRKTTNLETLIALKDKCKARGLTKSDENKLREAFAESYRKLKKLTNQPKGNEDGDKTD